MFSHYLSAGNITTNKPNISEKDNSISCDVSFNGINVIPQKSKKNKTLNTITASSCADVIINKALEDFPVGTSLDQNCACEITNLDEGTAECPDNKFIKTYYPEEKKVKCCSACTGDLKTEYDKKNCSDVIVKINKRDPDAITSVQCPANNFMKSFNVTENTVKINCCYPEIGGNYAAKLKLQQNKCSNLGITDCTRENLKNYEDFCKRYGLKECSKDNIIHFKDKCNDAKLSYINTDNTTVNPESEKVCHSNIINKRIINKSTFRNNFKNNLQKLTLMVKRTINNKYTWSALFLCVLLIIIIIFVVLHMCR